MGRPIAHLNEDLIVLALESKSMPGQATNLQYIAPLNVGHSFPVLWVSKK